MTFPLFDLTGRRALVTGSSQGIGLALARGLAQHGASVVLNGRDPVKLQAAADSLENEGYEARAADFDVTDPEAAKRGVEAIEHGIGAIDILINNAGMQFRSPLEDFPIDCWEQLLKTNISSVFYVGQAVARHMIGRGQGQDHQHSLGAERAGTPGHRSLHGHQRRGEEPDARHVRGLGKARPASQRDRARLLQDTLEPGAGR